MNEKKIYRYSDMMSMPRGIEMKGYYHGDGSITYIGQYLQPNGQPNARPKRVYRIEVRKSAWEDAPWWNAVVLEDGVPLVCVSNSGKYNTAYGALGALKGILHRRCKQTSVNRRRRRHAAESAARTAGDGTPALPSGAVGTPRPTDND